MTIQSALAGFLCLCFVTVRAFGSGAVIPIDLPVPGNGFLSLALVNTNGASSSFCKRNRLGAC